MGTLTIVATPIGNLEDITFRAVRVLKEADVIYAEQPKVTKKLLDHYDITTRARKLNQHAGGRTFAEVLEDLQGGKHVAYVTSAGTPAISDPGARLVGEVREALGDSVTITLSPGPAAVTALASVAGLPSDRFVFLGFPPHKKGRKGYFEQLAEYDLPVIFYESPHRIEKSLKELRATAGERDVVIGRELTKQFEEILSGTLSDMLQHPSVTNPKGEFVVFVAPKS